MEKTAGRKANRKNENNSKEKTVVIRACFEYTIINLKCSDFSYYFEPTVTLKGTPILLHGCQALPMGRRKAEV